MCFPTGFNVFAHIAPDAAALGVPIPGKHESPHRSKLLIGVFKFGNGKGKMFLSIPA